VAKIRETLEEFFSSLSDRDRKALLLGLPVILLLLYIFLVLLPLKEKALEYERRRELLLKKFSSLSSSVSELKILKAQIEPILKKVKKGKKADVSTYVSTVARMVGIELKRVRVMEGASQEGIAIDRVSVEFSEQPLNKIVRFILKLEKGKYYIKSDSIKISDYDGNGLVSGRVVLYFFREAE